MKKLVLIFSISVAAMVALVSCGGDNTPSPGQEQVSYDVVFTGVNVGANYQNVTPPSQEVKLLTVLSSANKDKESYVKTADIQNNESYVMIEGMKAGDALAGFSINLKDGTATTIATISLGKINADPNGNPIKNSTNSCLTFLSTAATNLATKKKVTFQIVFNGGEKDVSNLKITIHTKAVFSW